MLVCSLHDSDTTLEDGARPTPSDGMEGNLQVALGWSLAAKTLEADILQGPQNSYLASTRSMVQLSPEKL